MKKSTLQIAKDSIRKYFKAQDEKVFRYSDLMNILHAKNEAWSLAKSTNFRTFLDFLLEEKILEEVRLPFPHRKETRYIKPNILPYELALSLQDGSYLSHHTAVYLHGLSSREPENIYVNSEQSPKRSRDKELSQEKIDLAFKNAPRTTRNKANYGGKTIWRLNGMYTDCYGVTDILHEGTKLRVTNLERTLVDIAVRPIYSGGVTEVLNAYSLAKDKLSVERIVDTLENIGYIYPYHQAIGFYLDMAGIQMDLLEPLLEVGLNYDFYLTHQMKKAAYSERWKLYYPED